MDKFELFRGNITSGTFDNLSLSSLDISSFKLGRPRGGYGSPMEPEFFPSASSFASQNGDPSDQPPAQTSESGQPQQPQEQPQKEEELDVGKVIASLAPGGGE